MKKKFFKFHRLLIHATASSIGVLLKIGGVGNVCEDGDIESSVTVF